MERFMTAEKCWAKESVSIPKQNLCYILLLTKAQGTSCKRRQKECKKMKMGNSVVKCCHLNKILLLQLWPHKSYTYVHKSPTKSSQPKLQHWLVRWSSSHFPLRRNQHSIVTRRKKNHPSLRMGSQQDSHTLADDSTSMLKWVALTGLTCKTYFLIKNINSGGYMICGR